MKARSIKNSRVIVLGAGRSGLAAVDFLLKQNCSVVLYDGSETEKPVYAELREKGVRIFAASVPEVSDFDYAVISPGIPLTDRCAVALKNASVPIWGELEIASRFIKKPIIGITGTNGKTTTTTLIGEILKNAGYDVFVGGNIGVPLLKSLDHPYDYYVVEMSSFQLETVETMDAAVSVFLNLTPDHLDRHGSMENYLRIKGNLAALQSKDHFCVLNEEDPAIRSIAKRTKAKCFYFNRHDFTYEGCFISKDGQWLTFRDPSDHRNQMDSHEHIVRLDSIRIAGPHNLENAMAATAACRLLGIDKDVIADTLRVFPGVEHRLEDVAVIDGVRYVNDSKATNPDSVFKALVSFGDAPILLIAGGRNKGNSFTELGELMKKKCKNAFLIGEAAEDIKESCLKAGFSEKALFVLPDLAAAVRAAHDLAEKGDVVLLSPANASFDQFNSFEHRGEVFKDLVHRLEK